MCGGDRELKSLLDEVLKALAKLDARRLEEIALSCQALVRTEHGTAWRDPELRKTMAAFVRTIEATRANLAVLGGFGNRDAVRMEYRPLPGRVRAKVPHGND